jgi:hypothetical protein
MPLSTTTVTSEHGRKPTGQAASPLAPAERAGYRERRLYHAGQHGKQTAQDRTDEPTRPSSVFLTAVRAVLTALRYADIRRRCVRQLTILLCSWVAPIDISCVNTLLSRCIDVRGRCAVFRGADPTPQRKFGILPLRRGSTRRGGGSLVSFIEYLSLGVSGS